MWIRIQQHLACSRDYKNGWRAHIIFYTLPLNANVFQLLNRVSDLSSNVPASATFLYSSRFRYGRLGDQDSDLATARNGFSQNISAGDITDCGREKRPYGCSDNI
jgi:hypothetical protein